jgi:hypothetical protein
MNLAARWVQCCHRDRGAARRRQLHRASYEQAWAARCHQRESDGRRSWRSALRSPRRKPGSDCQRGRHGGRDGLQRRCPPRPDAGGVPTDSALSTIAMASPMSRSRRRGSFSRQRFKSGRLRRHPGEVRLIADHRGQDVRDCGSLEQALAGQHLVQHDAEGPYIGALVYGLAARLLRRHVAGCSEDDTGGCGRRSRRLGCRRRARRWGRRQSTAHQGQLAVRRVIVLAEEYSPASLVTTSSSATPGADNHVRIDDVARPGHRQQQASRGGVRAVESHQVRLFASSRPSRPTRGVALRLAIAGRTVLQEAEQERATRGREPLESRGHSFAYVGRTICTKSSWRWRRWATAITRMVRRDRSHTRFGSVGRGTARVLSTPAGAAHRLTDRRRSHGALP